MSVSVLIGLVFALATALASIVGFLYKHKGAIESPEVSFRRPIRTTLRLFRSKWYSIGIALALTGWGFHVAALSLAPISLVQSVIAGGLVLLSVDWSPNVVNHLQLLVEDEGPGIDPAHRTKLFEPFWTTRTEGTGGLGLAICKRIVEEAGGSIEVQQTDKGGACLRVELKIASRDRSLSLPDPETLELFEPRLRVRP